MVHVCFVCGYVRTYYLCLTSSVLYTDSVCYHVHCPDIYDIIRDNMDWFDTSNYPDDNRRLKSDTNKRVLGKMKDELGGEQAVSFVGLRPKMYSLLTADNETKLTAKGVPRSYAKKHLKHDMYLHTLKNKTITKATCHQIRSKSHHLSTIELTKVALSAFDNKRFILPDGISSVPYGHYQIGSKYN